MRSGVPGLEWLALAAIVGVATWLRLTGLAFGLPAVYNPDEVAIMSRALAFAKGDLNPHNFLYPTFYFYALFAWVGAWFVVAWATGIFPSLEAFQTSFFVDPSSIYLAGRVLGVVCGVATVVLVWRLGRKLSGPGAGLAAALFLAVAPTAVRDAHYVKHDVPVTLAITGAYLLMTRIGHVRRPTSDVRPAAKSSRTIVLAAAATGLAFSTHYYSIFLALPLAFAILDARGAAGWRAVLRGWTIAALVSALVFFALSPFILIEPHTAWNDIVANRQIVMDRAIEGPRGLFGSAPDYLRMLWHEAVGTPVLLAALAGIVWLAWQQPRTAIFLLAFPIPFLAFISNTVAAGRYVNPVLPFVACAAGYAIDRLAHVLRARVVGTGSRVWAAGAATGLVAIILTLPGLWQSYNIGRFFRQTDTRTLAQQAIEGMVPPGSTVLVQPYSVALTQSRESLIEALEAKLGDARRASTKFALRLRLDPYPAPAYRTLYLGDGGLDADKIYVSYRELDGAQGLEPLRRLGVEYVVLKRYNVEDPAVVPLRTMLVREGKLVWAVSPYRPGVGSAVRASVAPFLHNTDTPWHPALERPGPGLEVWSLTP
ncbi:MAG TPA: glycosyltransferase family 39 protein [Vicinamibacterales bacterium]